MAFFDCKFFSSALGRSVSCNVILPQNAVGQIGMDGKVLSTEPPVLYLLHGLSDDHTIWMRRTSIERYAADYGIAVVMPDGGRSFYRNNNQESRYWDFLSQELPAEMAKFFHISTRREDTFAAGLSMGGYGALKLALNQPERFAAAAMFSGAYVMEDMKKNNPERYRLIFGSEEETKGSEDDLMFQMEKLAKSGAPRPKLYMGCGTEDGLFKVNIEYRDRLRELGYDLTWNQRPGTHCWAFWDVEIQSALKWLPIVKRS